jgi:hypothetical protein
LTAHEKYTSPDELLDDQSLSRHEKIEIFTTWREDEEALMRAAEEGMQAKGGKQREVPSDLLRQIEKALTTLQENPPD